ncbi:hypothetical protein Tco_1016628 [Tanacetum coccineum]|uniref:Uncharacterized protein n=1 Tax=Tanacetum coccineum TaxID=301880 RepID=A0ABQ5FQI5_9ASTR
MKEKLEYKGNNVVGALMNVPIFVRTCSVVTDFAVLENIDTYRDEGMGDVIFGEPFLREVRIKAKRFKGMITIYNGNEEVSKEDKINGISHPFQKLKGFYKGVLNLGPDYIREAKMEEWLTRKHISINTTYPEEWIRHIDFLYSFRGPREGKSTNIGGEFINLEILKCWSLETSRQLFNTQSCSNKLNMENLPSNNQGSFSF